MNLRKPLFSFVFFGTLFFASFAQAQKPALTFDEFFNGVGFDAVSISPDGRSVVLGTNRADWEQSTFRRDLYLYRDGANGGSLIQIGRAHV